VSPGAESPSQSIRAQRPRRRRLRLLFALLIIGVAAGLAVGWRPLLVGFAQLFRVDDPARSDAMVVLIGGESDRPLRAAELYRRGMAPVILMGANTDTEANRHVLLSHGVPSQAIRTLGQIASTRDEALRVRDYARVNPIRRVLIVTTALHSARARWIFRRVLRKTGVDVRVAATDDERFDESNWYRSEAGRLFYLRELVKVVYYRLAY
jgi:uncharacterized SAM-binding protein YcdF (DUF218 family)